VSHPNARLTVHSRLILVVRIESGWSVGEAARAAGVSRQTAGKWARRFRENGEPGLIDASSRPHRLPATVPARRCRRIVNARLRHRRGPHWLSWRLHIARSTIYAVLRRFGLSRLRARRTVPVVRYEWPAPGDLVHLDVKKLGRIRQGGGHWLHGRGPGVHDTGEGWDFIHVAIDDHSRLAYAEICRDEQAETTVAFVDRVLEFFEGAGITTSRILTDNGANYKSHRFCDHLLDRGIKVLKTRPYHPQTNGKAEAFVKIIINEWAYACGYQNSAERAEELGPFLRYYNLDRPHGGIGGNTPISRVL
jgi:transposase InsO family protein